MSQTHSDLLGDETCEECESTGTNCALHWDAAAAQERLDSATHIRDADCAALDDANCCTECGAEHGDACPDCGGRAYHAGNCPWMLAS